MEDARQNGGVFHPGGCQIKEAEFVCDDFVEPAIAGLPKAHHLFQDEWYVLFVVVNGNQCSPLVSTGGRSWSIANWL